MTVGVVMACVALGSILPGVAGATPATPAAPATPATPSASSARATVTAPSRPSAHSAPANPAATATAGSLNGPISAPGGPFLRDTYGRVVILHGVNAVYKHAPYELYDAPGQPFNFSAADASRMANLGFNVVRLGIVWEGLEPGTGPSNDPAICTPGSPGNPDELNIPVLDAYLAHVKATVDLLGSYGIYSLLDMHQDLYSSVFGGEGAPPWAVCSDGLSTAQLPGRWSRTYSSPALDAAFRHFWTNDVVGNLQGQYDQVWAAVASYFSNDPWIVGYDPINEPFSTSVLDYNHHDLDTEIECFYTGTAHPGLDADGSTLACPAGDPRVGLIPTIEAADPNHLVFYESDIYTRGGTPNFIGPMDLPHLVFNFHAYCPQRNGHTGDPTDVAECAAWASQAIDRREAERPGLASPAEPGGPPVFMSEFGASGDPALIGALTAHADSQMLSWAYWSWKYYDDPTGSLDESLVAPDGQLKPTASVLAEAYPEAVAGTPRSYSFDPGAAAFTMSYVPDPRIDAPTVIEVPPLVYPGGYCPAVSGAEVTSKPGARLLDIENVPGSVQVTVRVTPGPCA
jgi:endoglycosylceramidase